MGENEWQTYQFEPADRFLLDHYLTNQYELCDCAWRPDRYNFFRFDPVLSRMFVGTWTFVATIKYCEQQGPNGTATILESP